MEAVPVAVGMSVKKNPAAVTLGKLGGKSKSPAKMAAMKENLAKAREAKAKKNTNRETT